MSINLQDVEDVKHVVVFQCISNAGTPKPNFTWNQNNIQFQPDFVIIRQITLNYGTTNTNVYVLSCDITNDPIASFCPSTGVSFHPQTLIATKKPIQQMTFSIGQVTTTNTLGTPTMAGTWMIAIEMDFIKLKKYDVTKVQYKS